MHYAGIIDITFKTWPSLVPVRLKTDIGGLLESIRGASAKRYFRLENDWEIQIEAPDGRYPQETGGTIVVPKVVVPDLHANGVVPSGHSETRLDGASVPFPWLVSFLSFGVLRPLGVLLIASIVHDFAFEHGGLVYRHDSGQLEFRKMQRHVADQLFYDMIRTVNKMPVTALLAWAAVRLGWFWVKYGGQRFGEEFPLIAVIFLLILLLALGVAILSYGLKLVALFLGAIYIVIFVLLQLIAPSNLGEVTE